MAARNEQEFESLHNGCGLAFNGVPALNPARGTERKNQAMETPTNKCPVCDWEIKDDARTVKISGQSVVVCYDDCAEKVEANPEKYLTRRN